MAIKRISVLDATFLQIETSAVPAHVAGLMVFQLPEDAPADFVKGIVQAYRAERPLNTPWNLKLARVSLGWLAPAMERLAHIDLDYHVRHMALPAPGGERELGELISHLHGQTLDRSRPLWTCDVIEGLSHGRFAIYVKMHHALTDGVNGIRMLTRSLADSATGEWHAPWHAPKQTTARKSGKTMVRQIMPPREIADALVKAFKPLFSQTRATNPVMLPFQAPHSVLNHRITAARRVATQRLLMSRIQHLARASGTSVNDVFLAVCSTALRRHLQASGDLIAEPLVAGVPVSLREEGEEGGNAVGFLWTTLATHIDDSHERLQAIHASMAASKAHLRAMPAPVRRIYTMLTMAPAVGSMLSGLGATLRPPMNIIISNVPGPETARYLDGARLEALYPISVPLQGMGLNITGISYDGHLDIGITGSRDTLPSLQKIAIYAREALDDLEATLAEDVPLASA